MIYNNKTKKPFSPTLQVEFLISMVAYGGFQLQNLITSHVIDQVTCYKFECSHWFEYFLQSEYCNFNQ